MPRTIRRPRLTRLAALALGALAAGAACAAPLLARRHADFAHYTFALTWQPGFCSTDGGCLRNQPHGVLIGLHGLWASRPRSLIDRRISAPQWWRRGCDYYHHSERAPRLSPAMLARLHRVMPHLNDSLLKHEYDKHVQCFGFDPRTFFATELRMRQRVRDSAFGRYLTVTARGRRVRHADVTAAFVRAFGTDQPASLQLRCGRNRRGQMVLTQLWITLHTDALARFPYDGALMNAPIAQDDCPARFRVPRWQ
ncbi:MAG: ribonuclease T2 family protein [Steroidobacteraceae bacterium]